MVFHQLPKDMYKQFTKIITKPLTSPTHTHTQGRSFSIYTTPFPSSLDPMQNHWPLQKSLANSRGSSRLHGKSNNIPQPISHSIVHTCSLSLSLSLSQHSRNPSALCTRRGGSWAAEPRRREAYRRGGRARDDEKSLWVHEREREAEPPAATASIYVGPSARRGHHCARGPRAVRITHTHTHILETLLPATRQTQTHSRVLISQSLSGC